MAAQHKMDKEGVILDAGVFMRFFPHRIQKYT